jgi:hypothetical protein
MSFNWSPALQPRAGFLTKFLAEGARIERPLRVANGLDRPDKLGVIAGLPFEHLLGAGCYTETAPGAVVERPDLSFQSFRHDFLLK